MFDLRGGKGRAASVLLQPDGGVKTRASTSTGARSSWTIPTNIMIAATGKYQEVGKLRLDPTIHRNHFCPAPSPPQQATSSQWLSGPRDFVAFSPPRR